MHRWLVIATVLVLSVFATTTADAHLAFLALDLDDWEQLS
jgi:hypothetical protein